MGSFSENEPKVKGLVIQACVLTGMTVNAVAVFPWGSGVALELGLGAAGTMAGLFFGSESSLISDEIANEGQNGRALLRALRASFEWAIGFGVAGATIGHRVGGLEGAMTYGTIGVTFGLGLEGVYQLCTALNRKISM